MYNLIEVAKYSDLKNLQIKEKEDIFYCKDTKEYYKWENNNYIKIEGTVGSSVKVPIEDLIAQMPSYTSENLKEIEIFLNSWVKNFKENSYFMLLGSPGENTAYYTVLSPNASESDTWQFGEAILSCLSSLGTLAYFENKETVLIFWIKDIETEKLNSFTLFDYTEGVVNYRV